MCRVEDDGASGGEVGGGTFAQFRVGACAHLGAINLRGAFRGDMLASRDAGERFPHDIGGGGGGGDAGGEGGTDGGFSGAGDASDDDQQRIGSAFDELACEGEIAAGRPCERGLLLGRHFGGVGSDRFDLASNEGAEGAVERLEQAKARAAATVTREAAIKSEAAALKLKEKLMEAIKAIEQMQ